MNRYRYRAKSPKGETVVGEVEASNPEHASKLVRQKGLVVVSITSNSFLNNFAKSFSGRIGYTDLTNFTRQLATMINAGLPITEALLILRSQSKVAMQRVVAQILADVEEGQSLSSAMSKYPWIFSKTYIALIKSGEMGGVLDNVLVKLSENMEKQSEFRGKVKGAMIYPILIIFGMLAVAMVMMIFVIPKMMSLYEQFDAELPLPTKILMGISSFFVNFWPLVLILIVCLAYVFKLYRNTPTGRRKIDEMIFLIPIIGDLQKQVILTDLTRTMSLMVGSGVSILESLQITTDVSRNTVITDALNDVTKMIEKGFPLAFAFAKHPESFPFILSQMVAVGEETGKMDEVLAKVSHVFEVESEQKVKALSSAIEPLILLILGIGVAFLVIAVILPIYNLTTQI